MPQACVSHRWQEVGWKNGLYRCFSCSLINHKTLNTFLIESKTGQETFGKISLGLPVLESLFKGLITAWKNSIYQKKPVPIVNGLFFGAKNGSAVGTRSVIVQNAASVRHASNSVCQAFEPWGNRLPDWFRSNMVDYPKEIRSALIASMTPTIKRPQ